MDKCLPTIKVPISETFVEVVWQIETLETFKQIPKFELDKLSLKN